MKKKPEWRAVPEETPVTKQKGLTKNDCDDRDVDRISHVAIKASHYELLCRRDRGGRPRDHAVAAGVKPHHVGGECCLIDKDEPRCIKPALFADPASARASHVGPFPL